MRCRHFKRVFLASIVLVLSWCTPGIGADEVHHDSGEGFKPGDFIFDHIADAHDWHILSYKGKHVSLPLPVILYSKHSGLHAFMSSRFHHGHTEYKGFALALEGPEKGKIVETLASGEEYLPLDFSITKNVFSIFLSMTFLLVLFIGIARSYHRRQGQAPKGAQSFFEPIILFVRDEIAKPSIGHHHERYMPFLLTMFFFIWFNNMLGLVPIIPGGANVTGNISVTLSLALFTFLVTTFTGNKNYWMHIFNTPGVPWWLKFPIPLVPIIEVMGMITKPFVLMVRLFANITAGHIIVLGFFSLIFIFGAKAPALGYGVSVISITFGIFMSMLELLVALIQAYVFTLLSALYFGMATEEHH
jgi:F-type H+-transporting ATPase subunit a